MGDHRGGGPSGWSEDSGAGPLGEGGQDQIMEALRPQEAVCLKGNREPWKGQEGGWAQSDMLFRETGLAAMR